jgi:hypothetical protein
MRMSENYCNGLYHAHEISANSAPCNLPMLGTSDGRSAPTPKDLPPECKYIHIQNFVFLLPDIFTALWSSQQCILWSSGVQRRPFNARSSLPPEAVQAERVCGVVESSHACLERGQMCHGLKLN